MTAEANNQTTTGFRTLNNKIVVVTGGTQGLGEGIARHLAELGAAGLVICGRQESRGHAVVGALREMSTPALYVRANLAEEAECRQVVRACDKQFGRVDGLVNAAGVTLTTGWNWPKRSSRSSGSFLRLT